MIDFDQALAALFQSEKSRYVLEEPMSRHTTFRIGGPARVFVSPGDERDLAAILLFCADKGIPYAFLGNGSNLLVSDRGFEGIIISMIFIRNDESGKAASITTTITSAFA